MKKLYFTPLLLLSTLIFGQLKPFGINKLSTLNIENEYKNNFTSPSTLARPSAFQIEKQSLDSVVASEKDLITNQYLPDSKIIFEYDAKGNATSEVFLFFDSDGEIEAKEKFSYLYDDNDKITQQIHYEWDLQNNKWIINFKKEIAYSASAKERQMITYDWIDSLQTYMNSSKLSYIYDTKDSITSTLGYNWDGSSKTWKASDKTEYTYDSNGKIIIKLSSDYEFNSIWTAKYKTEYTYASNGKIASKISSNYNYEIGVLMMNEKVEYTYDLDENLILYLRYNFDKNTAQFVPESKEEFIYKNTNIEINQYTYSTDSAYFILEYSLLCEFDNKGNPISETYTEYGETNIMEKYVYTYDQQYSLSELIFQDLEQFNPIFADKITNKPIDAKAYKWDSVTTDWLEYAKVDYFYSEKIFTALEEKESLNMSVYPNPFTDNIKIAISDDISSASFELYDLQGNKVFGSDKVGFGTLNLEYLQNGMYVYKLTMDSKTQSGFVIKK